MSNIAQALRLLGDETRLRILILIYQTPLNVSELTAIIEWPNQEFPGILSHLKK